ncbi:MAG TPA: hypothetical protein VNM14_17445 [Planctomycetota bacterium]|nr:hypothetical protein [Planctomycetota bacterium]
MNLFATWIAIALAVPNPVVQDEDDGKFRAVLSRIPRDQRQGVDWTLPADAKVKKSTPFPWVRVYGALKARYPISVVVDLHEESWTFTNGDPCAKWVAERLPRWVAESKQAIDTPERAREVVRCYITLTEEPYSPEIGEIAVEPKGDDFKGSCKMTQVVPSGCVQDKEGDLIRRIACSRKQVTNLTLTLERKGTLTVERKEEPSKGCRHVDK